MNCAESEKRIYLYNELTPQERYETDEHVKTCTSCSLLMQRAIIMRNSIKVHSAHTTPMANHAQMTRRIMDAVETVQRKKTPSSRFFTHSLSWNAFRVSMAVLSFLLVITFLGEYNREAQGQQFTKRYPATPGHKTELDLASFHTAFMAAKEEHNQHGTVLSECVNQCLTPSSPDCRECANKFVKPFLGKI